MLLETYLTGLPQQDILAHLLKLQVSIWKVLFEAEGPETCELKLLQLL